MISLFDSTAWKQRLEYYLLGWYYRRQSNEGIDIMAEDWDSLIILDACRYDTMCEVLPTEWPSPKKVISRAGNTHDFYHANFDDGPYHDTVVVSANPRPSQFRPNAFYEIVDCWDRCWNEEYGTVLPDVMARETRRAHEEFPDKRVLAHWIQPHYPFIGGEGELADYPADQESIWHDLHRNRIDPDDAYAAYRDTLETTIPHVQSVLEEIDGKAVVTSDHGNAFGEGPWWYPFPVYGHPRNVRTPETVEVPWLEFDCGPRRSISAGEPTADRDAVAGETVESRLEDLGYV